MPRDGLFGASWCRSAGGRYREIDQSLSIVAETEQNPNRRNCPLNSTAQIFDGCGVGFPSCAEKNSMLNQCVRMRQNDGAGFLGQEVRSMSAPARRRLDGQRSNGLARARRMLVALDQVRRGASEGLRRWLREVAIVLAIIGLILGDRVAAAAVYNDMRVSTANTEFLQITQAIRALYATSSTVDPGAGHGC